MSQLLRDIAFGFRLLISKPGFAAVAILTLALGIGANTAIFSVVYATLLADPPYPHPEQIVAIWSRNHGENGGISAGDFLEWQKQNTVFQQLSAYTGFGVNLATSTRPERVAGQIVSPGFISLLGYPLLFGRDLLPEEAVVGKDHEAVLANRIWKTRFAADPAIVGRQVQMNGEPYTIVGVLAPGVADRMHQVVYVPLAFKPERMGHGFRWLAAIARLKPGVTVAQANAEMNAIAQRLAADYPDADKNWDVSVEPLKNDFVDDDVLRALWLFMGAVGFLLLIACANVANLLLARGTTRAKEVAVRSALGASRANLFRQFLAESFALALVGCAAGVVLAAILLQVILAHLPEYMLPSDVDVRLNLPVLLFTAASALVAGLLFGSAPAWQASRMNLNEALKQGGRASGNSGRHGLRRGLVVLEMALALTLLAGGGLALHSLWNIAHRELGVRIDHLLTFYIPVPAGQMNDADRSRALYRQIEDRVAALPGVTAVGISEGLPVQGAFFTMGIVVEGKSSDDRTQVDFNMVNPGYFHAFGVQLDRGRALEKSDVANGLRVAVVNETFAKKNLAGLDPLKQRVMIEQMVPGEPKLGAPVPWQIVGVYRDVRNRDQHGDVDPEIDVPFVQSPWPQAMISVRSAENPANLTDAIADIVESIDPNLPLSDVKTMEQVVEAEHDSDRFIALLFASFAGIALLLAALGIYGVMSFAVAQRTHEIGLRMALGADAHRVLALILREGVFLALAGVALGAVGAWFVGRSMRTLVVGVGTVDPAAFAMVSALLIASAVAACYIPARRATRVDPMQSLRDQ
ncbi:MAG TPA: ABC transporter permease [Candidatus Acidoferrales bacterium]